MEERSKRPPLVHRGLAWGLSSVGEHLLCKQGVTGSNPVASTKLVEIKNLYLEAPIGGVGVKLFLALQTVAQPSDRASACSSTVCVAFSCLSGG